MNHEGSIGGGGESRRYILVVRKQSRMRRERAV